MELKRDIYKDLLAWKKKNSGHVLEIRGARQVGKTYILNKFAKENYSRYLYINMVQTSGADFLACLETAADWKPGMPRKEHPIHDALHLFDGSFVDDEDTIVIIDEIQESSRVFSLIRQFAREFTCHFVVTGSYLGKALDKDYFQPVGDLDILEMFPLTFAEFLDAVELRDVYEQIDLFGGGSHADYDRLKEYYDLYAEIGGYPSVVTTCLESGLVKEAQRELDRIVQIFINESEHHFKDILEMNVFEQTFPAIAQTMVKEKKGSSDLIKELAGIITQTNISRITRQSINQAISWLYRSHVIGYCGQATECDPVNTVMNRRFYFLDLGIAKHFLSASGADTAIVRGLINENFVYINLLKRSINRELTWWQPMFGTYKNGEIDFFVRTIGNDKNYGVEVKTGRGIGRTAQELLRDHKVEAVYYLKGDTYGGKEDRMLTVPICLAERISYDA